MKPVNFLKEVRVEMSKVVWPKRDKVLQLTVLVLVISIIIGIYIGGLDFIFTSIMNTILK